MLSNNWMVEGVNDFEYKKYILLAYLKKIRERFTKNELYPHISELIAHYNNLQRIKANQEVLQDHLPKTVSAIDLLRWKLVYETVPMDDDVVGDIFKVIDFAIPEMQSVLEEGRDRYEFIEKQLNIEPVGVMPLYQKEGYFILSSGRSVYHIYRYKVSDLQATNDSCVAIQTEFLYRERKSVFNKHNQIKLNLLQQFNDMPNPATYAVHSNNPFPFKTTLLPISERLLLRHMAA